MAHDHDSDKKYDIATFALLPMSLMLFIQMALNFYFAPQGVIFISPYLLALLAASLVMLFVLWKGQICPGQRGRLLFVLKFFALFAVGNFLYSVGFTPKHNPMLLVGVASIMLVFLFWALPDEEKLAQTMIYCGFGIVAIAMIQYLAIYWIELPSLFNWLRANNFAQLLLGVLLAGWYLMLAKSRLEGFLKLLVKIALLLLVMNYAWLIAMFYMLMKSGVAEVAMLPLAINFAVQFGILACLAWLLIGNKGKNIKNPTAWTAATFLAMSYPLTSLI
ncbi:hypothetical protein B0187_09485 [Haemophilus paracuniculus]|uniref:Uncharacterized protein n=1 Tax=Haemophilus paracuniculus TaxID=734 RepID=A0A1T0APW9_9PAST|nr:hypothetical protein [Haemophilus paracuniculus]OOR98163.1 hypothetical protein B0187_09485 [Haemophilus paracuniculus]